MRREGGEERRERREDKDKHIVGEMVEPATKFTLDKGVLDVEIAKQKEWSKVLICDHEGKVITAKGLGTPPTVTPPEIQCPFQNQK